MTAAMRVALVIPMLAMAGCMNASPGRFYALHLDLRTPEQLRAGAILELARQGKASVEDVKALGIEPSSVMAFFDVIKAVRGDWYLLGFEYGQYKTGDEK